MQVLDDYKSQFERANKECQLSQKKVTELYLEKKDRKDKYENELTWLKTEIQWR